MKNALAPGELPLPKNVSTAAFPFAKPLASFQAISFRLRERESFMKSVGKPGGSPEKKKRKLHPYLEFVTSSPQK